MEKSELEAKEALDKILKKSRLHLYKPTQIAEILYRDRIKGIDFGNPASFVNPSKQWRNDTSMQLVKNVCSSSDSYQKALFKELPIDLIKELAKINRNTQGGVEAYIYNHFGKRFNTMAGALSYCSTHSQKDFDVKHFLDLFFNSKELKKSVDKAFEIVVYALFTALVDSLEIRLTLSTNKDKKKILDEFSDFAEMVIGLPSNKSSITIPAHIHRVGTTNAADGGLDIWSSFGMAIQIKHIDLDEESAKKIVTSLSADRIVIVCKEADKVVIQSVLTQIGWKAKIQSIVTENELTIWYEKALRGRYANVLGNRVINIILEQIQKEFPSTDNAFTYFWKSRMYSLDTIPTGW